MHVNDQSNTAAIYLKCRQQILEGGFFSPTSDLTKSDLPTLMVENMVFSFGFVSLPIFSP